MYPVNCTCSLLTSVLPPLKHFSTKPHRPIPAARQELPTAIPFSPGYQTAYQLPYNHYTPLSATAACPDLSSAATTNTAVPCSHTPALEKLSLYLGKVELTAFIHIHWNMLPDLGHKALWVPLAVFQGNTMLTKSCLLSLSISKEKGKQQLENNFRNKISILFQTQVLTLLVTLFYKQEEENWNMWDQNHAV